MENINNLRFTFNSYKMLSKLCKDKGMIEQSLYYCKKALDIYSKLELLYKKQNEPTEILEFKGAA